jgi:hypothetical protein
MKERQPHEGGMGFKLSEISSVGINKPAPNPEVCCFNLIFNFFQQKIFHG